MRSPALCTLLDRKRLELARVLAVQPKVLLLDEIAGGLTEPEVKVLIELIRRLRSEGVTIIWIEHIVNALLAVVDRIVAINFGRKLIEGDPRTVMNSPELHDVYLGSEPRVSLLELATLNAHYGDFQALYGVSLAVDEGQTFAVIGANGAGKSTLLKTIAGLLSPSAGTIRFDGVAVEHLPAYKRVDARHLAGARGPSGLPQPHGAGEPADRLVRAPQGATGTWSGSTDSFRCSKRLDDPPGLEPLGGRAAGAGHRPGADGQSPAPGARRGVAGPRAHRRPGTLRGHPHPAGLGHDHL